MTGAPRDLAFSGGALRLRPETEADEAFRFALFCASRPPEEDFSPLGPALAQQLLRQQFRAQNSGYANDFPQARFEIVEEEDGAPVGYLISDMGAAEARIIDFAIVPERRSAGVGEAIVRAIITEAQSRGLPVRAAVLNGNRGSLRFVRRLGFEPVGEPSPLYTEIEWRGG